MPSPTTTLRVVLPLLIGPGCAAWFGPAHGQDSAAPPAAAVETEPNRLQSVVVTGSRGQQRTVTTSSTPIDLISAVELQRTGKASVLQALSVLVPSFNLPVRAGGSTASVISTGGLRGLNPDQTLVLVNGKRRHKSSLINAVSSLYNGSVPADLDLIPVAAIDHIEVLRDGAAAQYGSDAIAGVINIVLKEDRSGGAASVGAGQNRDRSDGQLYQTQLSVGLGLGDTGFADLAVVAKQQKESNRANPIDPSVRLYNPVNGQPDPREATADRLVTKNYGAFPQESVAMSLNAARDFGEVRLYSFGTLSPRRSELNVTFRAPNNVNALPSVYPDGFRPRQLIDEIDHELAVGAKGSLAGWAWDVSTTYGGNRARESLDQSINGSLGPSSPNAFYLGTLKSTEWVNSVDLTRGFDLAGRLQVSAGLQHRLETYSIESGDPESYAAGSYVVPAGQPNAGQRPAPGSQGASGITPADAGSIRRNNAAAYLDLSYDPTERLTLGTAARYEHYDDGSGNTLIGKGTLRFAVSPSFAVRGAYGNGFRAPALAQQIYSSTSSQFRIVGNTLSLLQIKTLPVGSAAAVALGAQPLKPEKSTNLSTGFVFQPTPALNIAVDAYEVRVRDRIAITGTLTGSAISAILVRNGLSPDISAQYYTNAIDTRTRGVDAVATYRMKLGRAGSVDLSGAYNVNKTKITKIIDNPTQLSSLGPGFVLFDRLAQGNLTTLLPKDKIALGAVWRGDATSVSTRFTHYGSYTIPQVSESNDRHFGGRWITDLELGWRATESLNLVVGTSNLFNVYPEANGIYSTSLGSQQYGASPPSPFGFTGAQYYARVELNF